MFPQKIDISHKTIIFTAVFVLGLWIIYLIRDLILILFLAVILMSALSPMVNFFTNLKLPKPLAITITYIIVIGVISGVFASSLSPLVEETTRLAVNLPTLLTRVFNISNIDTTFIQSYLTDISKNIFSVTVAVFGNFLTIVFLLVVTFYLLLEKESLEERIAILFTKKGERVRKSIERIEEKLGSWFRGQLLLSVIVGVLSYIGLILLNIPYAFPLATIAGVLEVVPVIGPIISAIPGILVALSISPILSIGVAAMYLVIQQLESHLIVPQVMKRAVGLNPLVVILTIAVGSRLVGVAGAFLAVPAAAVLQIIIIETVEGRKA